MDFRKVIGARLREQRQARQWTVEETVRRLSAIAGETIIPTRYGNWEQGQRSPRHEQFFSLAELFGVPAAYLAGFSTDNGSGPEIGEYTVPNQPLVCTSGGLVGLEQADDALAIKLSLLESNHLDRSKLLLIRAADDSMAGLISEGDRVLVDLSKTTVTGDDIFAILVNGRAIFRWIRPQLTGGYLAQAEKRDRHPDQALTDETLAKLNILGRVAMVASLR